MRVDLATILQTSFANFEYTLQKELYPAPKEINMRPETDTYRNILKMYVFLISWLISEQAHVKEPMEQGKKGKKKDLGVEGKILSICQHLLKLFETILHESDSLKALWRGVKVEEGFLSAFFKLSFDLMEQTRFLKESQTDYSNF